MEPILIDGSWREARGAADRFHAYDPATGGTLPRIFPVSVWADLDLMLKAGVEAAIELRSTPPDKIADFLNAFADEIEARKQIIITVASSETALPSGTRLPGELNRTTDQLRQAAAAAKNRSWVRATIDTDPNIRSMFAPLGGPVAVFGPNNFPLAFNGVSGGDFAAAIAAGNPVIAKANPAHPRTTQLLAEAALIALKSSGVPKALVQMFYHTSNENGLRLVSDPRIGATAFTGSRAGLHLKHAADKAGKPIYLEMSSVNPTYILPGALSGRMDEIADELFASCSLGTGQFCTNPGLVFLLQGEHTEAFIDAVQKRFAAGDAGPLLSRNGPGVVQRGIEAWSDAGATLLTGGKPAEEAGFRFQNTLMRATGKQFLANPGAMQTEAFGVASLIVVASGLEELVSATALLEGNLTGGLYTARDGADDELYRTIEPILRTKIGRLLNDKMPTGVAVVPSMVHGGPFPSTGHPGFTAVGIPAALTRFAALVCYDNVRPNRLPPELRDEAPHPEMWRYVNGDWHQGDISA